MLSCHLYSLWPIPYTLSCPGDPQTHSDSSLYALALFSPNTAATANTHSRILIGRLSACPSVELLLCLTELLGRVATGEGRQRERPPVVWVIGYLHAPSPPTRAHPRQLKLYIARHISVKQGDTSRQHARKHTPKKWKTESRKNSGWHDNPDRSYRRRLWSELWNAAKVTLSQTESWYISLSVVPYTANSCVVVNHHNISLIDQSKTV